MHMSKHVISSFRAFVVPDVERFLVHTSRRHQPMGAHDLVLDDYVLVPPDDVTNEEGES